MKFGFNTVCLFTTATKEKLTARLPDELESLSWSHIKGLLVQFLSNEAQLLTPPQFARENYKYTKSIFKKKETSLTEYRHKMRSGDLPAYLFLNSP